MLIEEWRRDLPAFNFLLSNSAYGNLKSTIPPITIPAWPAMFSGLNPGKLGANDFIKIKENYKISPVSFSWKGRMVWDIISKRGLRVGVVNVPGSINSSIINGFLIEDLFSGKVYPPELRVEIESRFGNCVEESILQTVKKRRVIKSYERNRHLIKWLLKKKDFRLFVCVITLLDKLMHMNSKKIELKDAYKRIDLLLRDIIKLVKANRWTLFITSDHGCKEVEKRFNINAFLRDSGFLSVKKRPLRTSILKIVNVLLKRGHKSHLISASNIVRKIMVNSKTAKDTTLESVDWKDTEILSLSTSVSSFSGLWINRRGKFHDGVIAFNEYPKIRNEVSEKLLNVKDPESGEKIVNNIYSKEEIYSGKLIDDLPDLIVEATDRYLLDYRLFSNHFVASRELAHDSYGVFIAYGPVIKRDLRIEGLEIFDIAPTILHLFELPIPREMDGKVLKEIFLPGTNPSERKVMFQEVSEDRIRSYQMSKEEEERVTKRLRELGYI